MLTNIREKYLETDRLQTNKDNNYIAKDNFNICGS
jgi:hypothetical protein